ncbi:MAG: AAA family ATPase [Arcobacteraceae bacterium]|nr:AAA family ATPase [Arcobacteraceae bacterium]
MENHFINTIAIKDFKCFKDFQADGFGRVNLIGGKNNVGKTAFMEACCINVYANDISKLTNVLSSPKHARNFLEIGARIVVSKEEAKDFLESANNYHSISNINEVTFNIFQNNGIKEYYFKYHDKELTVNINDFSYERKKQENIKFITQLGFTKLQLKQVFISMQTKDKEEILYKYINNFDPNVTNFKIIGGDEPSAKVLDREEYQEINEFGDGLKHYISIICSLYTCENGYLFIDEIDNGIHYTQLDELWEIILSVSKEQKVQVFATTHSKECIESFNRIQLKLQDKETYYFEMARNVQTNKIFISQIDSEQLEYGLSNNERLRGE